MGRGNDGKEGAVIGKRGGDEEDGAVMGRRGPMGRKGY